MNGKPSLEDRIRQCLANDNAGSEEVQELIGAVEQAAEQAEQAAAVAREEALDLSVSDLTKISEAITLNELTARRYQAALPKLRAILGAALDAEARQRWRAR